MTESLTDSATIEAQLQTLRTDLQRIEGAVAEALVGFDQLLGDCLIALCCGGHVLLEGVPGLGKTSLVKAIAAALGLDAGRVQCTSDLMPADILGTHIVNADADGRRRLEFAPGPIFHNLVLIDEINRATPKTQSALLEAMQEGQVSSGREHFPLPQPFFVMATQNPLEMTGMYPLPEAQLDRFMFKIRVPFPDLATLVAIAERHSGAELPAVPTVWDAARLQAARGLIAAVPMAPAVTEYAARLILATHPEHPQTPARLRRQLAYGASPRGLQALVRGARAACARRAGTAVSDADIRAVAPAVLRHRLIPSFEGEAEGFDADAAIAELLQQVPAPAAAAA